MSALTELTAAKLNLTMGRAVLKKNEYQQYVDASSMIQQAQERAAEIIADAKTLCEEEKQRGYQEGLEKAEAARAEAMLHTLHVCETFIEQNQRDIATLVMQVTRKVLGSMDDEQRLCALAQDIISKQRNHQWVVLHVTPSQLNYAQTALKRLEQQAAFNVSVTLQEDSDLPDGSCILETPLGNLDATLDSQLLALESALVQAAL